MKTLYIDEIRSGMREEFGYANDMMIPKLEKITLNMGVGEAVRNQRRHGRPKPT